MGGEEDSDLLLGELTDLLSAGLFLRPFFRVFPSLDVIYSRFFCEGYT